MSRPTSSSSPSRCSPGGTVGGRGGEQQQHQQQQGTASVHRLLTPQEAALRGASLAFQKQQHGGGNAAAAATATATLGRQATGSGGGGGGGGRASSSSSSSTPAVSSQPTGSSVRSQRDYADEAAERERERERKALFLAPERGSSGQGLPGPSQHLLRWPGARRAAASPSEGKSASFIAATLAASRSASPGTLSGGGPNAVGTESGGPRRSPLLRESVELRRGSAAAAAAAAGADEVADTTPLAPATSLISLFEERREADGEPGTWKGSADRPVKRKLKPRSPVEDPMSNDRAEEEMNYGNVVSRSTTVPSAKLRIDVDPTKANRPPTTSKSRSAQAQVDYEEVDEVSSPKNSESITRPESNPKRTPNAVIRAETPPPSFVRTADTVIVSPRPRRPETKPRLEAPATPREANENSTLSLGRKANLTPKITRLQTWRSSPKSNSPPTERGNQAAQQRRPSITAKSPLISVKARPPAPRKTSGLSERLSPELTRRTTLRRPVVPKHDGQDESQLWTEQDAPDARPTTSDSKSSNDSFVSASSVLTRDDTGSLLTVQAPSTRSVTPKGPSSRPSSTQPGPFLPIRRSLTGSSQLPLDSLSDAIMAGSLASARHTPLSIHEGRTPPLLPPARKKSGATAKHIKSLGRRLSPHRMKHTLRQPKAASDDEGARRPHHHKKGLTHKKHAHHEGARSRWREEITPREKKRYEAVWASNRGALLVAAAAAHTPPRVARHDEAALAEHVANVVVRDVWARSRLPAPELAEVWDLVHGHGRAPGGVLHGALNKQEFVVGMWLIDQRLRGRKIPPRVSESVWDSAKGLRVLDPGHGQHGHQHHHHRGKGKSR